MKLKVLRNFKCDGVSKKIGEYLSKEDIKDLGADNGERLLDKGFLIGEDNEKVAFMSPEEAEKDRKERAELEAKRKEFEDKEKNKRAQKAKDLFHKKKEQVEKALKNNKKK